MNPDRLNEHEIIQVKSEIPNPKQQHTRQHEEHPKPMLTTLKHNKSRDRR